MEQNFWRKCTTCKKPIGYSSNYLVCSVSTCNTKRAGMVFCGPECWSAHVPIMNHREAFWTQKKSPKNLDEALKMDEEKKQKPKINVPEEKKEGKNIIIRRKPN